jgi:hypothetical protein
MPLGINYSRARDLAQYLKTTTTTAWEIQAGDILVEETVWLVIKAEHFDDGHIVLHEVDGNDTIIPNHLRNMTLLIIDRGSLRKSV